MNKWLQKAAKSIAICLCLGFCVIGAICITIWSSNGSSANSCKSIRDLLIGAGIVSIILACCCMIIPIKATKMEQEEINKSMIYGVWCGILCLLMIIFILCMISLTDIWGNNDSIDECTNESWQQYAIYIGWSVIVTCFGCFCIAPFLIYLLLTKTSLFNEKVCCLSMHYLLIT